MATLPVISIAPLLQSPESEEHQACVRRLGQLASHFGFFLIQGHGIPQQSIDRVYHEAAGFFAQPESEKMKSYIGRSSNHRGYVPTTEKGAYADEGGKRSYEAFDSALDLQPGDADYEAHHRLLGPNVWPAGQPGLQAAITDYYQRVAAVGLTLCNALERFLSVPAGALTALMRKPVAQLRVIHYLEHEVQQRRSAMGAHTDYECLTLLHQRSAGLQVFHRELGWMDVPVLENGLVVMVGDMLEAWSNGIFRSCLHRVIDQGKERYSMPYFTATDFDAVVQPHPALVSEARPAGYEPIVAGHHLLGQLLRDFPYLRERHQRGQLAADFEAPESNRFEPVLQ